MTNQQIRLQFGEMTAAEMRLARAIVDWAERRDTKTMNPTCKSCQVPFEDHLGVEGLCRENQALRTMLKDWVYTALDGGWYLDGFSRPENPSQPTPEAAIEVALKEFMATAE